MNKPNHILAVALAIVAALSALSAPAMAQYDPAGPRLRVLTYNIHHGEGTDGRFDYQRLAKMINDLRPDIVAVQEVDRGTGRADGVDQAAVLGKLTGMRSTFGNAMHYDGGEYGEAVLSRYPILGVRVHHLPFRYGQEPRAALAVAVQPEGMPELLFVGTHLCHQSSATRLEQCQQLDRILPAGGPLPVILAGDLNARSGSDAMAVLLDGRWIDCVAPRSRIDYVLVRKEDPWQVTSVNIIDDRVTSDHRPVLVELVWTGEIEQEVAAAEEPAAATPLAPAEASDETDQPR
ncbi:MAG: endonuclease/exonuclease/phosphatase family protein [Pirellulales bacterium]